MGGAEPDNAQALGVWRRLVETWLEQLRGNATEADLNLAADEVLSLDTDNRIAVLHQALHGRDRNTAVFLLPRLSSEDLQSLFADLVYVCSFEHGSIHIARDAIRSLPRNWVLAGIEETAEPLLQRGDWETYRRLLELYWQLDADLTHRLATRAAADNDFDIREAGEDFLS